eukprot:3931108-Rhodomonas_salina.2
MLCGTVLHAVCDAVHTLTLCNTVLQTVCNELHAMCDKDRSHTTILTPSLLASPHIPAPSS